MSLRRLLCLAAGAGLALAAPALAHAAQPAPWTAPWTAWQSPHSRDHALTGRIWDVAAQEFVAPDAALDRIAAARYVALGERHDNPDHHRLQAHILAGMIARGRRPAVVWEMFDATQAEALQAFLRGAPSDAAGLGAAVDWDKTGWPAWQLYQPIADVAVATGLPMLAANLSRDMVKAISRQGYQALGDDRRFRLGLDAPLPETVTGPQRRAVVEGHCGLLPTSAAAHMVWVQAARDATMAQALQDGQTRQDTDGALLIAGNGHVRHDIGVPWHLRRLDSAAEVVTVGIVEVSDGETDPRAYGAKFLADTPPFDLLWFTPVWSTDDPCEGLAERFKTRKKDEAGTDSPAPAD